MVGVDPPGAETVSLLEPTIVVVTGGVVVAVGVVGVDPVGAETVSLLEPTIVVVTGGGGDIGSTGACITSFTTPGAAGAVGSSAAVAVLESGPMETGSGGFGVTNVGVTPTDVSVTPGVPAVVAAAPFRSTGVPTVLTITGGVGAGLVAASLAGLLCFFAGGATNE